MKNKIELKKISLADIGIDEDNIQELIADNPSIIGLGNLDLVERERLQSNGGRLDILLKDVESDKRYEVEIQLKSTDPSHIIRTLEYWDVERKRYPQFEHCAVIIAEDITNRFFNVISLFNGFIPIIAIQMNAYVIDGKEDYGIVFTKILNQSSLVSMEDNEKQVPVDRNYWEKKYPKTTNFAEKVLNIINENRGEKERYALNYVKPYIGLKKGLKKGNTIFTFPPRQGPFIIEIKLSQSDETDKIIDEAEIKRLTYDNTFGNYKIQLSEDDLNKNEIIDIIKQLFETAEKEYYD